MKLRVDTVYLRTAAATPAGDATMHFDVRQAPYTVVAEVNLHADSSALSLSIAMDPIPVAARVECAKTNENGLRSAFIIVSTPQWASLRLDRVEQSPEVCGIPAPQDHESRHLSFAPLVLGAGRVSGQDGSSWGVFVGAGVRIR